MNDLSPAPGNSFPGAGTQLPPTPGKLTHFSSIVNECDLSPAPGNSFPGAGTRLPPAPGKPTHFSSTVNECDFSPAPSRRRGTGFPDAGETYPFFWLVERMLLFLPALGKPTRFSSIVNECDLSLAPGNSFLGAGTQFQGKPTLAPELFRRRTQLPPAPGKPTHFSR